MLRFACRVGSAALVALAGCGGRAIADDGGPSQAGEGGRDPGTSGTSGGGQSGRTADDACTGVHEGDLVVETPGALEVLRRHRLVTGDLIVQCRDCETLEPLACLEEVGKMLSIVGCDRLESLAGLSRLRRVGLRSTNGGLGIGFYFEPWETSGNLRLRTLDGLGPLERMEGRFHVAKNPALLDLSGLAAVREVAGSFYIQDNDALPSLESLRGLRSVRGSLGIEDNDALVDLRGLEELWSAGGLGIGHNDALRSLAGLELFRGVISNLVIGIAGNPVLDDVSQLARVTGTLHAVRFVDNAILREVRLNDGIEIITGDLSIERNAALESFELPGLTHVSGPVSIRENAVLARIDVGRPLSIGALSVSANGTLTDTSAFDEVRLVSRYVLVDNNPALSRVTLRELQEIGTFLDVAANPALDELELGSLRAAETVRVMYNESLPSCAVDALLARVATRTQPLACDNSADACGTDCPPRP